MYVYASWTVCWFCPKVWSDSRGVGLQIASSSTGDAGTLRRDTDMNHGERWRSNDPRNGRWLESFHKLLLFKRAHGSYVDTHILKWKKTYIVFLCAQTTSTATLKQQISELFFSDTSFWVPCSIAATKQMLEYKVSRPWQEEK